MSGNIRCAFGFLTRLPRLVITPLPRSSGQVTVWSSIGITNPGSPNRGDPDGMPSSSAVQRTIQVWLARNSRIRGVSTSTI